MSEAKSMAEPEIQALSPYGRYLHHCAQGELAYQRSRSGKAVFHPRLVDPETADRAPDWAISSGLGRVYSVTLVHQRNEAPFALALIDLDEGFRMMSRIDSKAPETVAIGARVRVGFRSLAPDQPPLPVFTVEEEAR